MIEGIEIIEGGPGSGKSTALADMRQQLIDEGKRVIYINAATPIMKWFDDLPLPFKKTSSRINYVLNTLPDEFYLLVDNADAIPNTSGNERYQIIETLLFKAKGGVLACQNFRNLSPSLQARLKDAKRRFQGSGSVAFDMTYIVLAVIIVAVAMMGQHNLIFIAAAMRYMFQGMRIGGRV